jgi:hypothetical protein
MILRAMFALAALVAAGASLAIAEPQRSKPAQVAAKPSVACPMIYKPVCGWDKSGRQHLYSNECLAKAAGATVVYPAPCISDITF